MRYVLVFALLAIFSLGCRHQFADPVKVEVTCECKCKCEGCPQKSTAKQEDTSPSPSDVSGDDATTSQYVEVRRPLLGRLFRPRAVPVQSANPGRLGTTYYYY